MRIPPSVIVMSLLTAVPFGLGIKDTLANKQSSFDDDAFDLTGDRARAKASERRYAEYEREAAQEKLEREKRREERTGKLDTLYGKQPASLGSLFDGIHLGADAGSFQPETARERIYDATRDGFLNVVFDVGATQLRGLSVDIGTVDSAVSVEETCDMLREKLTTAWGRTTGSTWLDPSTHQRATVDSEFCQLRFHHYLEPTEWLAALHLDAIGMKGDKLAELIGADAEVGDESIRWQVAGVGYGTKLTEVEAVLTIDGKVGAIAVNTDADFDTVAAIRDMISAKRKSQPITDEGQWVWKGKNPVTLDASHDARFYLSIGSTPWQ